MWRKQLCWVAMAGGGADVDLALERMATDTDSCAHCGKTGVVLKRCARCLRTWYCGAECQRAGWKIHKKTCVPLDEVVEKLITAPDNGALREVLKWKGRMNELTATSDAADWRGVLKLEGRMEELMEGREDVICEYILRVFCKAHQLAYCSTDDTKHSMKLIPLQERRVHLLGKMERFRDQADTICAVADNFLSFARREEAESYYKRARKVGEKHGFFSVECRACIGLGEMAMKEGRTTEGLELLRNAVAAAPLNEGDDTIYEQAALECLTEALFATNRIDEVEPLVPRYREASKADTRRTGRLSHHDLNSVYFSARLHEARGRPQEAEREVRALLDLLRENRAHVQDMLGLCEKLLHTATNRLLILDPVLGEEELVECWERELSTLFGW